MADIRKLMKQAQEMQAQMARMQEELAALEVVGSAGGGMVEVTMNGRHEVSRIKIDPQVVDRDDIEMLEDLLAAAVNDAVNRATERMQEEMGKLTGGMGLPGLF